MEESTLLYRHNTNNKSTDAKHEKMPLRLPIQLTHTVGHGAWCLAVRDSLSVLAFDQMEFVPEFQLHAVTSA